MTVEYQKVWRTMNDLQLVTSKICSAREIIDNAIDAIQEHKSDKAELLMTAAYEYLEYYLKEFDEKFKDAWQATVSDLRDGDVELYDAVLKEKEYYEGVDDYCDASGLTEPIVKYSDEELDAMCEKATYDDMVARGYWMTADGFWMPSEKKKWILPVEETQDVDTDKTEYIVSFPQDLLEAANLLEGDEIEWIDNKDGSYTIRKVTKS